MCVDRVEKSTNGKSIHLLMKQMNGGDLHLDECIYVINVSIHFETVKIVTLHDACVILHTSSSFHQSFIHACICSCSLKLSFTFI